jgi:hypothetical protein
MRKALWAEREKDRIGRITKGLTSEESTESINKRGFSASWFPMEWEAFIRFGPPAGEHVRAAWLMNVAVPYVHFSGSNTETIISVSSDYPLQLSHAQRIDYDDTATRNNQTVTVPNASIIKYWQCCLITAAGIDISTRGNILLENLAVEALQSYNNYIEVFHNELPKDIDITLLRKITISKSDSSSSNSADELLTGDIICEKFREVQRRICFVIAPLWER